MHSSILLSFAGFLSFASAQIAADTATEGPTSVGPGHQVDRFVSFPDGSIAFNKSTVTLAAGKHLLTWKTSSNITEPCLDQYDPKTSTTTIFTTVVSTISSHSTALAFPPGAANVTSTMASVKPDESECACLHKRDDQDEDQDEICSQCFPDRGYGHLPSWRDDSVVQPSIIHILEDPVDAPTAVKADTSSGIEGPTPTPVLLQTNATVGYYNESSTVSTTTFLSKPKTTLTSTASWSSEFGNSTITGSSAPTNDATADNADSSSSAYMVSPKAKHSLAFWVAMWAVLALQIEGGVAGLW